MIHRKRYKMKPLRKFLLLWTVFFISLLFSYSGELTRPTSYHLKVRIEPESEELSVQGRFRVVLGDQPQGEFHFNLHGTFSIQELKVEGSPAEFHTERNAPWAIIPSSKKVSVKIPGPENRKFIDVDIAYHGKLEDIPEFGTSEDQQWALDDQINPRMIELATYSCWYPQFSFGVRFETDLVLSLPEGWNCVCSGEKVNEWKEMNRKLSRWVSRNDIDIVIVGSPQLKMRAYQGSQINIQLYHTQMPGRFLESEIRQIEKIVNLYTKLLGPAAIPSGAIKHVFSPKRKGQGSIARPGMVVTSEGCVLDELDKDPDFSLFYGMAHEIAHFWWNFGSAQGDWINETFAEYFASVADQFVVSKEAFERDLKSFREQVKRLPHDAPSLSSVPFAAGETDYVVRYNKGPLMLNDIRDRIGDRTFFMLCRDFFQEFHDDLIGTSEFRKFWGGRLSEYETGLNVWLDSSGGIPKTHFRFKDQVGIKAHGGAGVPTEDYLGTHIAAGFGITIPLERRLSLSLDLGYWESTLEEVPTKFYAGRLKAFPLLASLQFFPLCHKRFNPYVFLGGGDVFCSFALKNLITIPEITIDQDIKNGPFFQGGLGVDIAISRAFGVFAEAVSFHRKTTGITTITDLNRGTDTQEFRLNLQAWILQIGVKYAIE